MSTSHSAPSLRNPVPEAAASPTRWRTTPVVGGVAALLGAGTLLFPTPDPARPGFVPFTVCNVVGFALLIVAVAVLARLGVVGSGRLGLAGRIGLGAAVLALSGYAAAEAGALVEPTIGERIHPVTVPLLAVGMTVAGIATVRARVWSGWTRVTPLLCGAVPLGVELPWFLLFGPNDLIIALTWVCWIGLGAALIVAGRRRTDPLP